MDLVGVIQIIPATQGWVARFDGGEKETVEPLVCFALVEDTKKRRDIHPMYYSCARDAVISVYEAENYLNIDVINQHCRYIAGN